MADALLSSQPEFDELRRTFAALRGAEDEFEEFVAAQVDHLAAISGRLDERERDLESAQTALHRQLTALAGTQERLNGAGSAAEMAVDALRGFADRLVEESARPLQDELAAMRAQRERLESAWVESQSQANSSTATVAAEIASARAELSATGTQLTELREQLAGAETTLAEAIAARVVSMAQLLAMATTESSPVTPHENTVDPSCTASESSTNREQDEPVNAESTTDQAAPGGGGDRKTQAEGSGQWWNALKQLRSRRAANEPRHSAGGPSSQLEAADQLADGANREAVSAGQRGDDPVLDSVLAQFASLRNELGRTRPPKEPQGK